MMVKRTTKQHLVLFIAQGAYSGKSPFAPGTAGTVVGVLLYLLLAGLSLVAYLAACVLVTVIAIWTAGEAEKLLGKKDPGAVVIDEIAGFLVSMILVPRGWTWIAAGFFLFRFFDVVKPWPLRRLQDLHGGPGIVLDDIGAGVYTNIMLHLAALIIKS
jgi:phosphatidylglycerophosphatase A